MTRDLLRQTARVLIALAFCTSVVGGVAHAQTPATPVFPSLLDVHQVKVGSWADYGMTLPNGEMKQKMAIVARDEGNTTVEIVVQGGPAAAAGPIMMQLAVPRDPKLQGKPSAVVVQIGKNTPMQVPTDHPMAPKESFRQVDPKALASKPETIKVPAGSFSARRYNQTEGDSVMWLSEKVPPLGLVKMEAKTPMGPVKIELHKQGQGAKSALSGKPVPFDQNLFMQQVMAGMSGGGARK